MRLSMRFDERAVLLSMDPRLKHKGMNGCNYEND